MYETRSGPPRTRTTPRVNVVFPAAESPTTPRTTGRVIRLRMPHQPISAAGQASAVGRGHVRRDRRTGAGLTLLDQVDLGQQVLGHSQRGLVDQSAVERDRAPTRPARLLHRG